MKLKDFAILLEYFYITHVIDPTCTIYIIHKKDKPVFSFKIICLVHSILLHNSKEIGKTFFIENGFIDSF